MSRLLLTGATGFIGSHLVPHLLDRGHALGVVVRSSTVFENIDSRIRTLRHDGTTNVMHDIVASFAPDAALHLATYFVANHQPTDIDRLIDSNLRFGCQLLDALDRSGTKKLINFGTAWQHYETDDYRPVSLYAATKQAFDDLALYYADSGQLTIINLKVTDTYGPRDKRAKLIPLLCRAAKTGEEILLSPGDQIINLVFIDDILRAVDMALDHIDIRPVENFAVRGPEAVSLRDLVTIFETVAHCRLDIKWGARSYRPREIMRPWIGPLMPGWTPQWALRDGFGATIDA